VIEGVAAEVPADASPGSGQEQKPGQEAAPALSEKKSARQAILTVSFYLFLILSGFILQSSLPFNAPTATITIMPKSQQITYTGTSQLGRVIAPITLTQSQTVPTTGKGHQDARAATGTIVFYNGQAVQQTVPGGTVFTGAKGVRVAIDQTITIPPGDPPTYGEAAVPAHALLMGSAGNIPTGDITTTIAIAVFAKNSAPFHGGQDERDYRTVTKHDINSMTSMLKPAVEQRMQAAFQTYRHQSEGLYILPCAPKVTSGHKPGQEATQVKVTASETCSAVAYNSLELRGKVAELLTHQAVQTLGTGYSLIGDVQVRILRRKSPMRSLPSHSLVMVHGSTRSLRKRSNRSNNVLLENQGKRLSNFSWHCQA
jgi:Baseplate J-like protein